MTLTDAAERGHQPAERRVTEVTSRDGRKTNDYFTHELNQRRATSRVSDSTSPIQLQLRDHPIHPPTDHPSDRSINHVWIMGTGRPFVDRLLRSSYSRRQRSKDALPEPRCVDNMPVVIPLIVLLVSRTSAGCPVGRPPPRPTHGPAPPPPPPLRRFRQGRDGGRAAAGRKLGQPDEQLLVESARGEKKSLHTPRRTKS